MRKTIGAVAAGITFLLLAVATSGPAAAETLTTPAAASDAQDPPPVRRGQSQAGVLKLLGEPALRYPPVGGDSPQHPEIIRWDYDGFSVFFERERVIDVVRKGEPMPVAHPEELQPAP